MFRVLISAAFLLFAAFTAHAACVPNTGYPWPTNGCLASTDLNAEFASIIANGAGTLLSAPKPSGGDDRPAIQAFLTANCSKGPILFFGAYKIGYPGLVPPRNCVYGGGTTWMASPSSVSGYPAPTMFSAFGTWTDDDHCIINQNHDGQYVHDLTLVGTNQNFPMICGIRALNSAQWVWNNVNTFQTYRGKELIGDALQPGDTVQETQVGEILYGSDVHDLAEGLFLWVGLPSEGFTGSFVSDMIFVGLEEENDCNSSIPYAGHNAPQLWPNSIPYACAGVNMAGSIAGITMTGNFKIEDEFQAGAYGLIAWEAGGLYINGLGFDLIAQADMWFNGGTIYLNGISATNTQNGHAGCGHIRLTAPTYFLNMSGNFFDTSSPIFEADSLTGYGNATVAGGSITVPLNAAHQTLYCPVTTGAGAQAVVSPVVIGPPNNITASPANPTGVSGVTAKMMGLGAVAAPNTVAITPAKTGNILVTIDGNSTNVTGLTAYYGTGTAPANQATVTGTSFGTVATGTTFHFTGLIPAAAVTPTPTPVWVDLAFASSSGTATVTNLSISLVEQ